MHFQWCKIVFFFVVIKKFIIKESSNQPSNSDQSLRSKKTLVEFQIDNLIINPRLRPPISSYDFKNQIR